MQENIKTVYVVAEDTGMYDERQYRAFYQL